MVGSSNSTPYLQVRQHNSSSASTVYFINAASVGDSVAVDTAGYNNLLSSSGSLALTQDWSDSWNLRDYQIAGKMFSFQLSSTAADQKTLYGEILAARASNTPILGYIPNESSDVPFLSGTYGLFLNAADNYYNGSVWASMLQPSSLSQPTPAAIQPVNGTVYVALAMSDGDNIPSCSTVCKMAGRITSSWAPCRWPGPFLRERSTTRRR